MSSESVSVEKESVGHHSPREDPVDDVKYFRYLVLEEVFELPSYYSPPIRPVGKGAYGSVCSAVKSKKRVAIKKIHNAFVNIEKAKMTLREIRLLSQMDHDNIIPIIDVIRPRYKETFKDVYIVMELMFTDLGKLIWSMDTILSDDQVKFFIYQILRGLKYMHSANVLHRDLKPSNLLINLNCELKIADFGFATVMPDNISIYEYVVSRYYRAPELLLLTPYYTPAVDIWSVGCIFAELCLRYPLFCGISCLDQLDLILQIIGSPDEASMWFIRSKSSREFIEKLPKYSRQNFSELVPNMSPTGIDLLEKMLVFDPSKRITAEEALSHPYLSTVHCAEDEPICSKHLDFDFENQSSSKEEIRELVWRETLRYNPNSTSQYSNP